MAGSSFGTILKVTTWGESHGPAIGAVVDGCPAGIPLEEADFESYMNRRRPNGGPFSTKRTESDRVEILSGVFEGLTTGTPISLLIRNSDHHSGDYDNLKSLFRPGHADFGFTAKYGIRDHRGGGRSSGRETAARVAAGAIAAKALRLLGVTFETRVISIGGIPFEESEKIASFIEECRARGDSAGSEVECIARGVPSGIGDPVFDKLDSRIAQGIFSIGAVKALEIGDGIRASSSFGSENNDAFYMEDGSVRKLTNHAGGILGGISDGSDIRLHVFFKPTPSISLPQQTVSLEGSDVPLTIRGRHDPVIGPRAAVVVEAMTALVLFDSMLLNMTARFSRIQDFYRP